MSRSPIAFRRRVAHGCSFVALWFVALWGVLPGGQALAGDDGLVVGDKGDAATADAVIDDSKAPPEQNEALKLFLGTWRCTGTSATDAGADIPTTFTLTGKKDLGGRWLIVRTELQPKAKGAKSRVSEEIWGYSLARGTLVRAGAHSQGGFLSSSSTGWAGPRLAFAGESSHHGAPAKEKLSFERKSDKELTVQLSEGAEELHVVFEGVCKR